MNLTFLILIVLSLSLGIFELAFSLGKTFSRIKIIRVVKIAGILVLLQIPALVAGWFSGEKIENLIKSYDHWIPISLLIALGMKMIFESIRYFKNLKKFKSLTVMMIPGIIVAIFFDMIIVGLSVAFYSNKLLPVLAIFALMSLPAAMAGIYWGKTTQLKYGIPSKILGGLVFISLGINYWLSIQF
jgi:putative Mn2+ efflux pump MntP